jgi:hypothetical protein
MANNLLDTIKKNMQQPTGSPSQLAITPQQGAQASDINQTSQVSKLLAAGSGKATAPGASPTTSNLAEQIQQNQAQLAQDQVAQQGQQQAFQLGQQQRAQEQKVSQQNRQLTEQGLAQQDEFTRQNEALLNSYQNGTKQMNLQKDKARLEQLGFDLRLGNQQYLDNLQREGARSRLDNQVSFGESLQRAVWDDENELFSDSLEFRTILGADQRSFNDQIAQMDLDFAMQVANAQAQEANQRMMWEGIGGLTSAGVKAYGAYEEGAFDSEYQDYSDSAGKDAVNYRQYRKMKA